MRFAQSAFLGRQAGWPTPSRNMMRHYAATVVAHAMSRSIFVLGSGGHAHAD